MSEERVADAVIKFSNALKQGKKPLKIELFLAEQWRSNWNPYRKTMHPHPPLRNREPFWQDYYRLRVDGRWHRTAKHKYCFYTLEEAIRMAAMMSKGQIRTFRAGQGCENPRPGSGSNLT